MNPISELRGERQTIHDALAFTNAEQVFADHIEATELKLAQGRELRRVISGGIFWVHEIVSK
ncbi:hypothetical protein EMIT053CA3_10017 [Pseudomonas donghuensis]